MPNWIDSAMPSTDASIDVIPLVLQKNGNSPFMATPDTEPERKHHPHAERRGRQQQDRHQNAHVGRLATAPRLVTSGVSSPASHERGQERGDPQDDRARPREYSAPTVALPIPLKSKIVNNTTLSP